ncbi:Cyclic di-GMP phosphodiesterase Gmr [compost metagenome]
MDSEQSLERVTQQVLQRLAAPFCLGDEQVYVSASIGITLFPQDGDNIDVLQRNADQAMYAAKKAGRNGYCYYAAMPRASLA